MITTSKPRRRWSQYSLRTLLVLMLVASIGLSWMRWIASELQPYRKQREVANAIISQGGSVQWDTNWPRNESRKHPWLRKVLGDEFFAYPYMVCVCDDVAMEYILELPQPAVLALTGSQATDSGLKRISELTQLRSFGLINTQVTDTSLVQLKPLTQLEMLHIEASPVTNAGLEYVKQLTQLQGLALIGTDITDAGLVHLRELPRLHCLILARSQITDAGLQHIKKCTQLLTLDLSGTQVSDSGVSSLQKALPNCRIQR